MKQPASTTTQTETKTRKAYVSPRITTQSTAEKSQKTALINACDSLLLNP
ncbi:MAG: hypothetical protein SFY68_03885 [Candidatus Sumerlaeia bacterium]|nr:hypothetical protein [Candidatus Sumerlaeia bacterium]